MGASVCLPHVPWPVCGKEEEENLQYLNLSDIACTFTGEDNLPFTVTVYAYADWTAESDASWAKVGDKTAGPSTR